MYKRQILYIGVKTGLYPSLIFLGVGAMTDFGPLLANQMCIRDRLWTGERVLLFLARWLMVEKAGQHLAPVSYTHLLELNALADIFQVSADWLLGRE